MLHHGTIHHITRTLVNEVPLRKKYEANVAFLRDEAFYPFWKLRYNLRYKKILTVDSLNPAHLFDVRYLSG
jgi:hypothetical protein